jgi:hypothetical protein
LQWLQDPSELNGDNLNNIRHEASRHFTNKKKEYMKDKIDELATNSKNKNIRDLYRGINYFKKGNRSITDQIFCSHQILEKKLSIMRQYINYS